MLLLVYATRAACQMETHSLIHVWTSLDSSNIHTTIPTVQHDLLAHVLRLPMSFYDTTPMGRLISRFSRDVEAVDVQLPEAVSSFISCLTRCAGRKKVGKIVGLKACYGDGSPDTFSERQLQQASMHWCSRHQVTNNPLLTKPTLPTSVLWGMLLVVIVTPIMALAYIPLGLTYARVQKQFVAASRELKRLDSVALSPIYSHFLETLAVREPGCPGSSATWL